MSEQEKKQEETVFDQKLDLDELNATSGGNCAMYGTEGWYGTKDADQANCSGFWHRPLYGGGGFPNCAATVEDGSNCWRNDGCREDTVVYDGKTDCWRSWR